MTLADTLTGISLDAVATLTGAVGKMMLRHAAVSGNLWFYPFGLFFTAFIDPIFDVAAYSFAAGSVVTACAGLVIVWTVLFAPCFLGEPVTRSRAVAALLIVIGTAGTGAFGTHTEVDRTVDEYITLFTRPEACSYYLFLAATIALLVRLSNRCDDARLRGFYLSAVAGLMAGNTFTTKAAVEMLDCIAETTPCSQSAFTTSWFYVLCLCSLLSSGGSLLLLGYAERSTEALPAITVFEGFLIISGSISGNLVLDEARRQSPQALAGALGSMLSILLGLTVMLKGEWDQLRRDEPSKSPPHTGGPTSAPSPPWGTDRSAGTMV
eukprot:scaffold28393_cov31-Tisochrysis_lutea.AAC.1